MEMISALVYQLTQNLCIDDIKKSGFDAYFVDHTAGIYPVSAAGIPFSVSALASKGDIITDLHEDLAADGASLQEQRGDLSSNGTGLLCGIYCKIQDAAMLLGQLCRIVTIYIAQFVYDLDVGSNRTSWFAKPQSRRDKRRLCATVTAKIALSYVV